MHARGERVLSCSPSTLFHAPIERASDVLSQKHSDTNQLLCTFRPCTSQAWKRRLSKTRAGIAMQQLLMAATSSPLSGHSLFCVRIWARKLLLPKPKTCFALFFALRQCAATPAESNPSAASLCAFSIAALPLQLCYRLASSRAPASTPTSHPPPPPRSTPCYAILTIWAALPGARCFCTSGAVLMLCSVALCVLLFTIAQLLPSRRNALPSTLC